MGGIENKLVYYKKGSESWGTPLIITGIPNNYINPPIEIYPNPAMGNIWIKTQTSDLPMIFELVDLKGQILMNEEINSDLYSINIDNYDSGIYIYRIHTHNGIYKYGKLRIANH